MEKYLSQETILIIAALKKYSALPTGQIALVTNISINKIKNHLTKLTQEGFLNTQTFGAHKYFKANAKLFNSLNESLICDTMLKLKKLHQLEKQEPIREARTCYGHCAGIFSIRLKDKFVENGLIFCEEDNYQVTHKGWEKFIAILGENSKSSKKIEQDMLEIKLCLDWTERQYHLAGNFGKFLTNQFFHRKWFMHLPGSRAIKITEIGKKELENNFGLLL